MSWSREIESIAAEYRRRVDRLRDDIDEARKRADRRARELADEAKADKPAPAVVEPPKEPEFDDEPQTYRPNSWLI